MIIDLYIIVNMAVNLVFWTVLSLICVAEAGTVGDQCDWTGRYGF